MDILLKHISKKFDQRILFQDINISILDGRMNCLMGASGTGKTTLTNILMGLIKPDSGEIVGIDGLHIAAVFQEDRLIEHWNAVDNIRLVCPREMKEDRIIPELSELGIVYDRYKPVREYSGGMRRRVAILRAMLAKSELLILDEPFRGLDYELKKQVIEYIKTRQNGRTILVVTHDREDVELLGANLIMLN